MEILTIYYTVSSGYKVNMFRYMLGGPRYGKYGTFRRDLGCATKISKCVSVQYNEVCTSSVQCGRYGLYTFGKPESRQGL